ncbi:MAG: aminotransferase class I/II-fold pyridoxal phosphate-dependent enzyme [Bacteroidota bacterium]
MYWPKLTSDKIKKRVINALNKNVNYRKTPILGVPATYLDSEVFYDDAPFLENAPFLSTLIANPNHIGCHTLNGTEKIFIGTQELEKDLIKLCAEQIFGGEEDAQDGYVASGGTEANIEAIWIYRNYFINQYEANVKEIGVIFSEDSHYSLSKAVNLLNINSIVINTDENNRELLLSDMEKKVDSALAKGIKYFIVNMNLSTTMFGSVDDIDKVTALLNKKKINYKLHIDAAFGGFIYPFTNTSNSYSFKNPNITSITIDAHKMLQTPYGTGIFLIRKGYMQYVKTTEAQYVPGTDHTLCGSRSGANAVAVWMVLHNHGSEGWKTKMRSLVDRTTDVCCQLDDLGIRYFRNPYINIIAIHATDIPSSVAEKYFLVVDSHEHEPKWWKIVIMPHITRGAIDTFINDLKSEINTKTNLRLNK